MLIVAVSNCHGSRYGFYLTEILKKYFDMNVKFIYYYNALYINKDLEDKDKEMIGKADIVICQKIISDINERKYIHHDVIKNLINPNCKFIIIPYITNIDLYWKGPELLDINKFISYSITDEEFNNNLIQNINKIRNLCINTDLDLADIILSKYDKYQYFRNRNDPTGYFFIEGAIIMIKIMEIKIDESINILDDFVDVVNNDTWGHDNYSTPIAPNILNKLKLKFDNENIIQPIFMKQKVSHISYIDYFEYIKNKKSFLTYVNELYSS